MKKYLFLLTIAIVTSFISNNVFSQEKKDIMNNTALIIIDIQNFYFPGGTLPLFEPEKAAHNAQKLLNHFRKNGQPIIHVRHTVSSGAEIHDLVAPIKGEKVISKDKANAFVHTDLLEYLQENKIENLILCGMQTHMCLEAATRAASDYGFNCTVVEDACTTRDLSYGEITVKAKDVHYATLSSLNISYATIKTTQQFLNELKNE